MCKSVSVYLSAFIVCICSLSAHAQTDVAVSLYGAFNSPTSSNGTTQSPSNTAGGLLELRHIWNPFVGLEATYSYNRADQAYSTTFYPPCPVSSIPACGPSTITAAIPNNAHEITADYLVSMKLARFRPFVLAGGGLLLNLPASGTATATETICTPSLPLPCPTYTSTFSISTSTQTKAVYVYGAGIDWTVVPHIGLRFQYRGNLYKAADLSTTFGSTNFTHNSEPMIGAFFRF